MISNGAILYMNMVQNRLNPRLYSSFEQEEGSFFLYLFGNRYRKSLNTGSNKLKAHDRISMLLVPKFSNRVSLAGTTS